MKPYQNVRDLDPTKVQFDAVLSKIRVIVKRSLAVLKGIKVEMFAKRIRNEKVPGTIAACRILHNICIKNGRPDPAMMILFVGRQVSMQTQSGMF